MLEFSSCSTIKQARNVMESTATKVEAEPGHFTTALNPCRVHPGARL